MYLGRENQVNLLQAKAEMEKPLRKIQLQHFSHDHPLEHTRAVPTQGHSICFGCKLEIFPSKRYYNCKTCPFFLHQVCYSMPQKVQHPVDPNHHFILLAMPSSSENSIECDACLQYITGFYYNCACGHFYHALCLATPLSIKLPVHTHTLNLEFLPPYDFQCDLCDKVSYRGWLYRCGLCEFDAHISCAMMDRRAKLETLPETERIYFDGRIDDNNYTELMELLSRKMEGIEEDSNKENFQREFHSLDQSAVIYDKATPSYQFSDACFSIDFAKSFLNDGNASVEAEFPKLKVLESKEATAIGYVVVPKGTVADLVQPNPAVDVAKSLSFDYHIKDPKKGKNSASPTGVSSHVWGELDRENQAINVKASKERAVAGSQTEKSNSVRCRCSCW